MIKNLEAKNTISLRKRSIAICACVSIILPVPAAAVDQRTLSGLAGGSQFGSAESSRPGLIRVNLIGGTATPGKYFVPPKTDLFELISLAGGVSPSADVEAFTIRRRTSMPETVFTLNAARLLAEIDSKPFYLEDNDVILINAKTPVISPEVVSIVNFSASLLSITATLFLLKDRFKRD